MAKVIGVKFRTTPKIYYFEAGENEYSEDCYAIVETTRGLEMGQVAMLPTEISDEKIVQPLKPIVRIASAEDLEQANKLKEKEPFAFKTSVEKIDKSGLSMKVIDVEYTFDGSKLIIYFIAEGRVDFRELVRELAMTFKVRIELRQIGARDECKMIGGLAPCGRACCCSDHLNNLAHVTIKMAKNQNLSLSPTKISGLCGRLMCCLSYENDTYIETNKRMPKVDSEVETADGKIGRVVQINQVKETVTVRFTEDDTTTMKEIPLVDIKKKGKGSMYDDLNKDEKISDELKGLDND